MEYTKGTKISSMQGWDILIRMELLTTLTNYQLKNSMDEETVKRLAIDICEALVFCQKKGLIHRDIKQIVLCRFGFSIDTSVTLKEADSENCFPKRKTSAN